MMIIMKTKGNWFIVEISVPSMHFIRSEEVLGSIPNNYYNTHFSIWIFTTPYDYLLNINVDLHPIHLFRFKCSVGTSYIFLFHTGYYANCTSNWQGFVVNKQEEYWLFYSWIQL